MEADSPLRLATWGLGSMTPIIDGAGGGEQGILLLPYILLP